MPFKKITFAEALELFNEGDYIWRQTEDPMYREDEDDTEPMYHALNIDGDEVEDLDENTQYYYNEDYEG